jgi:predicted DNA-binding protein
MSQSALLAVRLPDEVKQQFIQLSQNYGGTAHVMRELITAFVENRVEIAAPKNPLYKEK